MLEQRKGVGEGGISLDIKQLFPRRAERAISQEVVPDIMFIPFVMLLMGRTLILTQAETTQSAEETSFGGGLQGVVVHTMGGIVFSDSLVEASVFSPSN